MTSSKPFEDYDPAVAERFVSQFEGCELKAYRCPAGVLTIGYGHTGPDVVEGMVIDVEQAQMLLVADLKRHADGIAIYIRPSVTVTEGQYIALLSLAFNIGVAAFRRSSVLRNLNVGAIRQAADAFLLWNQSGGRVLAGLKRRRAAERRLFLQGAE